MNQSIDQRPLAWLPKWVKLPTTGVSLAHFGCKVLGNLKEPVPAAIMESWDQHFGSRKAWKQGSRAVEALSETLHKAAVEAGFRSLTLWDTMRTGSDFWRPGKLLSEAASLMVSQHPAIAVNFLKLDDLCPSIALLDEFRRDEAMPFAEYAHRYGEHLRGTAGLLERATERILLERAMGSLPAFYCVDPYIPGYAVAEEMLRVPYRQRTWMKELRSCGCHRVILAEEIIRFVLENGLGPVTLFELDATSRRVFRREFSSPTPLTECGETSTNRILKRGE